MWGEISPTEGDRAMTIAQKHASWCNPVQHSQAAREAAPSEPDYCIGSIIEATGKLLGQGHRRMVDRERYPWRPA